MNKNLVVNPNLNLKSAEKLLNSIIDLAIEEHIGYINSMSDNMCNFEINNTFEPIFLSKLDSLVSEIVEDKLRTEIISKAKFRYGYIPLNDRVDNVAFVNPAPSQTVKQWLPNHHEPF